MAYPVPFRRGPSREGPLRRGPSRPLCIDDPRGLSSTSRVRWPAPHFACSGVGVAETNASVLAPVAVAQKPFPRSNREIAILVLARSRAAPPAPAHNALLRRARCSNVCVVDPHSLQALALAVAEARFPDT